MAAYNQDPNYKPRTFYRLVTDDKHIDSPMFYEQVKEGDRWVNGTGFKNIQGYLKDIIVEEYTDKKGKKRESVKFIMDDDASDKQLVLSMGMNMLARGILNSLASEPSIGKINLSGYLKDGNDRIGVKVNGKKENSSWKYKLDEIPKPEETTFKGEILRDYTEADKFFKNVINIDIKTKIISEFDKAEEDAYRNQKFQPQTVNAEAPPIDDGSDLPF